MCHTLVKSPRPDPLESIGIQWWLRQRKVLWPRYWTKSFFWSGCVVAAKSFRTLATCCIDTEYAIVIVQCLWVKQHGWLMLIVSHDSNYLGFHSCSSCSSLHSCVNHRSQWSQVFFFQPFLCQYVYNNPKADRTIKYNQKHVMLNTSISSQGLLSSIHIYILYMYTLYTWYIDTSPLVCRWASHWVEAMEVEEPGASGAEGSYMSYVYIYIYV